MEKTFEQWWEEMDKRLPDRIVKNFAELKETMRIAFYAGYRGGQVDMRMEMLVAMSQEARGATER